MRINLAVRIAAPAPDLAVGIDRAAVQYPGGHIDPLAWDEVAGDIARKFDFVVDSTRLVGAIVAPTLHLARVGPIALGDRL